MRLKIADDNDLNTAKDALATVADFFESIAEEAARRGGNVTPFGILQVCPSIRRKCNHKQDVCCLNMLGQAVSTALIYFVQEENNDVEVYKRTTSCPSEERDPEN